jgi:hypothetical protein
MVSANCTEIEAMKYIHDHHCYSLSHAIQHEGYSLVPVENRPADWYKDKPKPAPELTTRLSWRTKKDQHYQSFGCGQTHVIRFLGTCESCGRSVYSHGCIGDRPCGDAVTSAPDPRGIIPPEHCANWYEAEEYDMTGRDVLTCYRCSEDSAKYHSIIAAAKSTGTWKAATA